MTKPARKQRLSVYLDPAVMNRLVDHAARRDQSRSLIAEAAIESFLSPDAAERQEDEFSIGGLPEQEVAEPHLSAGPDDEIRIRHIRGIEV